MKLMSVISDAHNLNGGCTFDIIAGKELDASSGYIVSIAGYESIHGGACLGVYDIAMYLKNNLYRLLQGNYYIGTWYNSDNNTSYIDLSTLINNKEDAILFATQQGQLTIFDLSCKESIPVNNTLQELSNEVVQ